jgi:hypothetical protein
MFYTRCYVALIIMEIITESDLNYMCNHDTDYMDFESKKICNKYLNDKQVTNEILKIYAEKEIETWGDMRKGLIEFKYKNTIIIGKYNKGDYPAEILSISNAT